MLLRVVMVTLLLVVVVVIVAGGRSTPQISHWGSSRLTKVQVGQAHCCFLSLAAGGTVDVVEDEAGCCLGLRFFRVTAGLLDLAAAGGVEAVEDETGCLGLTLALEATLALLVAGLRPRVSWARVFLGFLLLRQ